MPTVLHVAGFRVMIYLPPREHGPPHVHVWCDDSQITVWLGEGDEAPSIERNVGMYGRRLCAAYRLIDNNLEYLREQWRKYHG